jgi:hypothetical protein
MYVTGHLITCFLAWSRSLEPSYRSRFERLSILALNLASCFSSFLISTREALEKITTKPRVHMYRRKLLLSLVYALEIDTLAHGDGTGHGGGLADLHSSVELGKTGTAAGLGCSSSEEFLEHICEFCHEGFQGHCVTASNRLENEPGNLEDVLILASVVQEVTSKILDDDLFCSRKAGADLLCDIFWSEHGRDEKADQTWKFARSERLPFQAVCALVFDRARGGEDGRRSSVDLKPRRGVAFVMQFRRMLYLGCCAMLRCRQCAARLVLPFVWASPQRFRPSWGIRLYFKYSPGLRYGKLK